VGLKMFLKPSKNHYFSILKVISRLEVNTTIINPKNNLFYMKKVVLDNGLSILFKQQKRDSVVIEVMIKVGSNHELPTERGIAHFLEHILFEGTLKRPTNMLISNEIEKIGGEFNAYTTNERTCFYVKVLKRHFKIAVDILADILQNSLFKEEHMKREKNVVLKEIDMVHDDPRFLQWMLFQSTLFVKSPAKYPTYGERAIIKNLSREKTMNFFHKYYIPNNMVISIVGDIKGWKKEIEKKFSSPKGVLPKVSIPVEPKAKRNTTKIKKRKIANTYTVLGFKTVPRSNPDAYVLEVINGILGRGQSGRMFTEIRTKLGLAYDVGTQSINEVSFGYFSVYASIDKKNKEIVRRIILKELQKLQSVTEEDIQESKTFIEGAYSLELEDSQKLADQALTWEHVGNADLLNNFVNRIKKVTRKDVQRVANKYFKNYTFVVLEGR
jgi:predicted Zn-dependent peptidase